MNKKGTNNRNNQVNQNNENENQSSARGFAFCTSFSRNSGDPRLAFVRPAAVVLVCSQLAKQREQNNEAFDPHSYLSLEGKNPS